MAADDIFYFLVIAGFFTFIIYLSYLYEQNKKKDVMIFFLDGGYLQSNPKELKFKDLDNNITYEVQKFSRGYGKSRYLMYRLTAIVNSIKVFNFKITRRGALSKLFEANKGEFYDLNDNFNVSTTNPIQIQYFFSDQVFQRLESFFRSASSLEVISQSGLMTIEVELAYINRDLFKCHDFVVFLIEELLFKDPLDRVEFEEYICFNCKKEISFLGDFCQSCGVIAPKCVICFDDPEPQESLILFDCCKSYAHRDHAYTWINEDNICPSCRAVEPLLKPIEELE